jgi:hypothetical protein
MYEIEHTVACPLPEITVDGRVRREILGQQPPLAARATDIANGIENLADIGFALAPATARQRDHRLDDAPLGVAAVARVSAATRLMRLALLLGPHGSPLIRLP